MDLGASLIILLAGAFTSALAVVAASFLPWNVMGFMVNFILPVGAFCVGLAAAAGYYFAARGVNHRPGYLLCAGMTVMSAAAWLFGYWLSYHFSHLDDSLSFFDYMNYRVSHTTMSHRGHDEIELGKFGYGLALLQLAGFVAPAWAYFGLLRKQAFCEPCAKFFKGQGSINKQFENPQSMQAYLTRLNATEPFSYPFCDVLKEPVEQVKITDGTMLLYYTLKQCPGCKAEIFITDTRAYKKGVAAKIAELSKTYAVPQGRSLLSAFSKQIS